MATHQACKQEIIWLDGHYKELKFKKVALSRFEKLRAKHDLKNTERWFLGQNSTGNLFFGVPGPACGFVPRHDRAARNRSVPFRARSDVRHDVVPFRAPFTRNKFNFFIILCIFMSFFS